MNENKRAEDNNESMRDLDWLYFLAQQRGYDDLADEISKQAEASQLRLDDIESQMNEWQSQLPEGDEGSKVLEMPVLTEGVDGWQFTLYVTGRRNQAFANLREVLADRPSDSYSIRVVNVDRNPRAAEQDGIVFTPTVVARYRKQRVEFVGDISRTAEVRRKLALAEQIADHDD